MTTVLRADPSRLLPGLPHGAEVLVVRLRSLGDVVLLTPALAALNAWRPDLRLSVLVEPPFAPVLEGNPSVARVIVRRGFAATVRELRRTRFAAAFNQHGGSTSAILTAASGAPARVCWRRRRFAPLYNVLVDDARDFLGRDDYHTVEERLTMFRQTGLPEAPPPAARVYPREDALEAARRLLDEDGLAPGTPYLVVHPGGNYPSKTWPMERFAAVATRLREERGLGVVALVGPAEGHLLAEVRERFDPLGTVLAGLDLRLVIALVSGAALFLGNDSGPAHLAAAAGRPVTVVFGSSNADRWRPWMTVSRVARSPVPCAPCPGRDCGGPEPLGCILGVTVQEVVVACLQTLDEAAGTGGG